MSRGAFGIRAGLAACALLLGGAALAPAQGPHESPVQLSVGGVAGPIIRGRPRSFVAVRVLLENHSTAEASGAIRVYRAAAPGKSAAEQSLYFERHVALPRGGRRAETVYYYCQEDEPPRQLCVTFLPDEGPAPPPVFPDLQVDRESALVLVVSSQDAEDALAVFRSSLIPGPRRPWRAEAVRADVSALPDHMAGYDPFDVVVVTDLDQGDLAPERARALLDWVEAGGDLVVSFTGRLAVPAALRPVLPVERPGGPDRAVERSLVALRALGGGLEWPGSERVLCDHVVPAPAAEVLAGAPDAPLILRGRHGAGWVTYLAFPLDAAPLRAWKARPLFAGSLVRLPRAELLGKHDAPMVAPPLEELQLNLSEALATLTPPSALLIAPLLLLYVALVSPVNYVLLSRRRRLHLSQPVAAAVVLLFGGAFYGIGRVYKGSEDMTTQVAILELPTERGKARVDVMTGYYSTSQALVSAQGPPGAVVGPIAEEPAGREGRVIDDPAGARLDSLTVATWSLRRFRSLRAQDLGAVALDLRLEDSILRGSISNRTQMTLEAPTLLMPNGFVELGEPLAPGATFELRGKSLKRVESLRRADNLGLLSVLVRDASAGYPAVYGRDMGVGGMRSDPYGTPQRRILATFEHRLRRVPGSADRLPVLLVAWAKGDAGGVVVEGTGPATLARQVVLVEGQAALRTTGRVALESLEPRVLTVPRDPNDWIPVEGSTGAPPLLGAGLKDRAEVTFCWRVPSTEHAPLRADMLRLRWHIPGLLPNIRSYVDAYDFKRGAWVELTSQTDAQRDGDGMKYWSIPGEQLPKESPMRPDDLIDPSSGTVLFRFRNEGTELRIGHVSLEVAGTR